LRATVPRWQGMSGGVRYVWDAENRLRAVIPAIPVAGQDRKVEYGYDYLGRRVIRRTYDWDGQALAWTGPVEVTKYVYNGWRVIMELDGLAGDIPTRKFSWGLDLAAQAGQLNSLESAGGIGGLLAAEDSAGTGTKEFIYFADANGNIGQVVETTAGASYGTVAAHYEYAPFGKRINPASPTEYDQPYRFSSKPFDPETELGYWGYRHYSPELGRWISRDPIGDTGGMNLYRFAVNNPVSRLDSLGLFLWSRKPACKKTTLMYRGDWTKYAGIILGKPSSGTLDYKLNLSVAVTLNAYERAVWTREFRNVYKCLIGCNCVYVAGTDGLEYTTTESSPGDLYQFPAQGLVADFGPATQLFTRLMKLGAYGEILTENITSGIVDSSIYVWLDWGGQCSNPAPKPGPTAKSHVRKTSGLPSSLREGDADFDCSLDRPFSNSIFFLDLNKTVELE
jgi:RHS repeat-associated protein